MSIEHKISSVLPTGELIDLPVNNAQEVSEAYELVERMLTAYRELKRQITERGMQLLKEARHE